MRQLGLFYYYSAGAAVQNIPDRLLLRQNEPAFGSGGVNGRYQYGQVAALQQIANNGPLILRGGQGGNGFLQRVDVGFVLRTEKHGPFAFRCLRRSAEQVAFVVGYQKGDPLLPEQGDQFFICEVDTRITEYTNRKDEIGELAIAFNAMADSLAQAEQKRSEFVANVSHELKTPMTTIAGFADGILDGTIPPEKERESLQVISSETRRLSRLVRRMLELSRLQSSERVAAQEQFDVAEVLLRVLVSLESKITEKDLDVQTQLPDGPVMVWGDPDAVTQVCYNLLDNAVKFSSPQGRLTLRITTKAGKAYIAIGNQGETIPPQQLTHIFDRFHKADSSRSTHKDGVGLGLYIVKTILNTYKEDITVTSQDGFTEFTFTLSEV